MNARVFSGIFIGLILPAVAPAQEILAHVADIASIPAGDAVAQIIPSHSPAGAAPLAESPFQDTLYPGFVGTQIVSGSPDPAADLPMPASGQFADLDHGASRFADALKTNLAAAPAHPLFGGGTEAVQFVESDSCSPIPEPPASVALFGLIALGITLGRRFLPLRRN